MVRMFLCIPRNNIRFDSILSSVYDSARRPMAPAPVLILKYDGYCACDGMYTGRYRRMQSFGSGASTARLTGHLLYVGCS